MALGNERETGADLLLEPRDQRSRVALARVARVEQGGEQRIRRGQFRGKADQGSALDLARDDAEWRDDCALS